MKKKKDPEYLFSEELRTRMSKFGNIDVREAIKSPEFMDALLDHAGMTKEDKKNLWKKVGRPDIAEILDEDEKK